MPSAAHAVPRGCGEGSGTRAGPGGASPPARGGHRRRDRRQVRGRPRRRRGHGRRRHGHRRGCRAQRGRGQRRGICGRQAVARSPPPPSAQGREDLLLFRGDHARRATPRRASGAGEGCGSRVRGAAVRGWGGCAVEPAPLLLPLAPGRVGIVPGTRAEPRQRALGASGPPRPPHRGAPSPHSAGARGGQRRQARRRLGRRRGRRRGRGRRG